VTRSRVPYDKFATTWRSENTVSRGVITISNRNWVGSVNDCIY